MKALLKINHVTWIVILVFAFVNYAQRIINVDTLWIVCAISVIGHQLVEAQETKQPK